MVSHFRKVGGRENPYRASWERRSRSRSITYHPSLITHHSSLITHHSSLITHHLARRGGYHLGRYEYPLPCWCLKLRGRVLKLGLELELEPIEEREKKREIPDQPRGGEEAGGEPSIGTGEKRTEIKIKKGCASMVVGLLLFSHTVHSSREANM